jgi:hypothetical protein
MPEIVRLLHSVSRIFQPPELEEAGIILIGESIGG